MGLDKTIESMVNYPIVMNDQTLTVTEAANMLGISKDTLRRWDREGIAHALRTPTGHRRFTLEEVQRLMPKAPETTEAE